MFQQDLQAATFWDKVEVGKFERSYRRAPRGAERKPVGNKPAPEPAGICHLCLAGCRGHDWEDAIFS